MRSLFNMLSFKSVIFSLLISLLFLNGCTKEKSSKKVISNTPVALSQTISVERNSNVKITLSATDANGDLLTYILESNTSNGTLSGIAPNLIYTPAINYLGSDTFTFKVNDSHEDSAIATIYIQVIRENYVKKTMQTISYDENATDVSALASSNYKFRDDGFYQKGVTPRYTRASDIVSDDLSGLMWQDNNDTVRMLWSQAVSYCSELSFGGYTDWRLPSRVELIDIIDYSKSSPSVETAYFNNILPILYWSSTTYTADQTKAYAISFDVGSVNRFTKDGFYEFYVRCVRSE